MDEAGEIRIEKAAIYARAKEFERLLMIGAIGVAGPCRPSTQALATVTCVARFPLNLVVVKLNVEIPGPGVSTVNEDELETIQFIDLAIEITDIDPCDPKGSVAADCLAT